MLPPLIGPQTLVVPFQNGVDSVNILTKAIGRAHVAGGTCYVSAVITEPGRIKHTAMNRLIFGPLDQARVPVFEELEATAKAAGIDAVLSDRINVDIWAKFARLTAFSGMTALTRSPIGVVVKDPDLFAMMEAAVHESIAVARGRQSRCLRTSSTRSSNPWARCRTARSRRCSRISNAGAGSSFRG